MERRVRISQCMIVKDEEKNIEKALSWGKDIMWEQIVADTGSGDRTASIAGEMGAAVYSFEWKGDFAEAKNFAIEQARGEWIAFLDADESIPPEMAERILPILEKLDGSCVAVMMPLVNVDDDGSIFGRTVQIRLFRNLPGLRYKGRIHENLALDGIPLDIEQVFETGDEVAIYHTGYSASAAGGGQKARRNRLLVEEEIREHPDDSSLMGYLADCCRAEEEFDEAIRWYEQAEEARMRKKEPFNMRAVMTLTNLMLLLGVRGRESRLREVYRVAAKGRPEEADFEYIMGKYLACKGEYVRGIRHLERALTLLEQSKDNTVGTYLTGQLPQAWELTALCHYHTDNRKECVRRCTGLLQVEPYRMSVLKLLLLSFKKDEEEQEPGAAAGPEQVLAFLGKLYDFGSLKGRLFVLKGAAETEYAELVRLLRGTFTQEELDCLDGAAGKGEDGERNAESHEK